jgi:SNF2 family DNA or RNA helicase
MYGGTGRVTGADILVTTYATLRIDGSDDKAPLVKARFATVVADEIHLAKNKSSLQSLALRRAAFHADTVVGLTGTPVTRDTGDIFPVLQAMDPASWPARSRFVKRYLETRDDGYGEVIEGIQALREPEFRGALAGQYRRVAKGDVLDQLPPKTYSVRRVEIPPAWRKAYDTMQEDMLAELPEGGELPVMSVLAQLTRLGQLASSACDVAVTLEVDENGAERKHYEVTLKAPSWKADALLGILAERPGQQVAVFANSKQLITIAGAACAAAGYRTGYVTGEQGRAARLDAIDSFQAGQLDVIACTAGAGGLGITLTKAGTVVMLQRSYELDKAVQPEDRAHRIGNEHEKIEVIDVVARDTVDERARELIRAKGHQLGRLVQDPRIVRELLGGLR